MLERKLQDAEVPAEEQNNILKHLEKKETEYMRLQRHKMGVEDFELLTIIGRGAFGEVPQFGPCCLFICFGLLILVVNSRFRRPILGLTLLLILPFPHKHDLLCNHKIVLLCAPSILAAQHGTSCVFFVYKHANVSLFFRL